MGTNVVAILETVLSKAQQDGADEIRFLSDLAPMLIVGGVSHFALGGVGLNAAHVRAIHHECLASAGRRDLVSRATVAYQFISLKFGTIHCKFSVRGDTVSLVLKPEGDAPEVVLAKRFSKPPAVGAEAIPDETADSKKQGQL